MGHSFKIILCAAVVSLAGCAGMLPSESEKAFKHKLPEYTNAAGDNTSTIKFQYGKAYETEDGVPLNGEPVVCTKDGLFAVNLAYTSEQKITVPAGQEVSATIIGKWVNSGWEKTCWPLASFIPEKGKTYVVVNERVGGKGFSMLWTGVARQSCRVSVYEEGATERVTVPTQQAPSRCR
jgi:hypothetical protein